jgi:hypothetical protein
MQPVAIAIVVVGALFAATAAFLFRWEVYESGQVRLDRWTGTISICQARETPGELDCNKRPLDTSGLKPVK